MKDSQKRDPLIAKPWTNDTFNSVNWQANQSSFSALAPGRKIQISKYAHEWTPTIHKCAQAKGNKIDRRCFACGNLKETVNHMLQCKSDQRVWQPEPKPSKNSANTYHDMTHQHQWQT
jgi:hypothetical protein